MIAGQVNARNEAIVPVRIYGVDGQLIEMVATVDTGFSGYPDITHCHNHQVTAPV